MIKKIIDMFKYKEKFHLIFTVNWFGSSTMEIGDKSTATIHFVENSFGFRKVEVEGDIWPHRIEDQEIWYLYVIPWAKRKLTKSSENSLKAVASLQEAEVTQNVPNKMGRGSDDNKIITFPTNPTTKH